MIIKLLTDTRVNGKYEKTGTVAETSDSEGSRLLMLGWAEELAEEVKAPKKASKKKSE